MPRPSAARPDAIRRHNLGLVLQQVHLEGTLTRAELTARSGLSRSTIGGLVSELAELALVDEEKPVGGPRAGRPSHVVRPRADGPVAIAVDVDVRQVTAAAIGLGGRVLARHVVPIPGSRPVPTEPVSPAAVAEIVARAVPALRARLPDRPWLVGVGISVPGTADARTGHVGLAPNLGWRDVALGELMASALPAGLPVSIGNDADLAVLAEHRRGSARGCDDVVYLLGRVGVGAGILVGGRPLRGSGGLAGEVGHTVLDLSGEPCHCGGQGCVETLVGDAALLRLAGGPRGRDVAAVLGDAATGEPDALAAVRAIAAHLGRVVANVVNLLNPQLVVMGGSLREVLLLAQPEVEAQVDRYALAGAREMVQICPSALADDGSLVGAAELAFGPLLTDPLGPLPALREHVLPALARTSA